MAVRARRNNSDGRARTVAVIEGWRMDPVSLVEIALTAGAVAGIKNTASVAVMDAYTGLKDKVKQRFAGHRSAEIVLASHETDPENWKGSLATELAAVGIDDDLVAEAYALMHLLDEPGSQAGKYSVKIHGGRGVQIGDSNVQHNTF